MEQTLKRVPVMVSVNGTGRGETRMDSTEFQKTFGITPQFGKVYTVALTETDNAPKDKQGYRSLGSLRSI